MSFIDVSMYESAILTAAIDRTMVLRLRYIGNISSRQAAMCIAIQIPAGRHKDHQVIGFYEEHSLPVLTRSEMLRYFPWGRTYGSEGARW